MFRSFRKSHVKAIALCACVVFGGLALAGCSSREQRAQNYYERGADYLKKNDFVKARIELRNALQIKNNMVDAWRALAQVDEHDRNFRGLANDLRRVSELDPKDVDAKVRLGRLFLMSGAFDDALKAANAANDLDPKNTSALALKAAVLFKLKDADGAVRTANEALAIDPNSTEASVVLAATQFMQGDSQAALKALDNVKADKQDDFGVMFLKISIFERLGDLGHVETLLRRLVELYPTQPTFRTQLVRFYVAHNRQDDAVKELRAVVAASPGDTDAELELVDLLGAVKGPASAREELVARIGAGGSVFPYQIALAKRDFQQGNLDDSVKLLQQLIAGSKASDEVATARVTLAEIYMSKNNVAAAEPLINDILKADSRNISGLMLRASVNLNHGRVDDAIADLRTALNDQPQSPELLANLAIAYERNGSIELADKAFLDATKASRYSPTVGLNYVAFLRRRGLTAQADTVLNDLASRNPNSIPVLSALAQVKLSQQDWAGAHTIADAIRRLGDKTYTADAINSAAFTGEKKFNDSLSVLQDAYNSNPNATQPMAALVSVYLQAKQTDRAENFLQAALKANPNNAEALVLMGSIQLAKNDTNDAIQQFNAAIKAQPKNPLGYRALADLYTRQRNYDDALKVIRLGLEAEPTNFPLRMASANLLELKRDFDGAINEYEAMLKDQPGSMVIANNLASLLADHRTDKASLDRANSLGLLLSKSQVPQFKDTLGWIAYQRDDYRSALSLLESAGAALPNNALVRYHLGMSYLATGQSDKASEQFKKARDLAPNDTELITKIDAALNRADKTKG